MKRFLNKKVYYVLSFLIIWLLIACFAEDRMWVYNDVLINGETVMVPDFELKPDVVSGINILIAFFIHSLLWLLVSLGYLIVLTWNYFRK